MCGLAEQIVAKTRNNHFYKYGEAATLIAFE
jgi:hypothetical protein